MRAEKIALVLHGWPPVSGDHMIHSFLRSRGYKVIAPNLFILPDKFNLSSIKECLISLLDGSIPDLIIGISLGGLIVPYIAEKFPRTRLVFIATGPFFKPSSLLFKFIVLLFKTLPARLLLALFLKLPENWSFAIFKNVYGLVCPRKTKIVSSDYYNQDVIRNFKELTKIPIKKELEALDFARSYNNCSVLQKLPNESLVFSGEHDDLMPLYLGKYLNQLLPNSRLIITSGSLYNVFTKDNLTDIGLFLS